MPELAEVEVVRRNLVEWWQGRRASEVTLFDEKLLKQTGGEALDVALRRRLESAERRGKYLLCHLGDEGEQTVMFHFRMTGKIVCCDHPEPDYARLSWFVDDVGWLVFKDQRRLGEARLFDRDDVWSYKSLAAMGPEPEDVDVEYLREVCSDRRMLKTALLDQSIIAGVGNVAVTELFWRLKLSPDVKCGQLSEDDWKQLVNEIPTYFDEVIDFSMADEIRYLEETGSENLFQVYRREGEDCPRCGEPIQKTRVGGRSSYFCENCQK